MFCETRSTACTNAGRWCQLLPPFQLVLKPCCRRPTSLSGTICHLWSHADCHQAHPYFPCSMLSRRLCPMILPKVTCSSLGLSGFPWVSLGFSFKNRDFFHLFQSVGTLLVCQPQMWWTVVYPLYLTVPSGPLHSSHHVPWTCAFSGSLDGLRPDLLLKWVVLHSPRSCLCLFQPRLCDWLSVFRIILFSSQCVSWQFCLLGLCNSSGDLLWSWSCHNHNHSPSVSPTIIIYTIEFSRDKIKIELL